MVTYEKKKKTTTKRGTLASDNYSLLSLEILKSIQRKGSTGNMQYDNASQIWHLPVKIDHVKHKFELYSPFKGVRVYDYS